MDVSIAIAVNAFTFCYHTHEGCHDGTKPRHGSSALARFIQYTRSQVDVSIAITTIDVKNSAFQ